MRKTESKIQKKDMSRRSFLALGGAAAATVAATSLSGCGNSGSNAGSKEVAASGGVSTQTTTDIFSAPAPIEGSAIVGTKDYDIVIIGAGISGVCAALAAVEGGASVAVLQKVDIPLTHGNFISAINCPECLEAGTAKIDIDSMMKQFNENNSNMINWKLVRKYFDESPESSSWLLAKAKEAGATPILAAPVPAIKFEGKIVAGITALAKLAETKGVEFFYATPGEQLIKDGDRVTGVIGKSKDGYIRFNAAKAVVIATGCYGNNREMQEKYCPGALPFENFYAPAINDGDGHLMGLWVGGQMQQSPHPKMIHVHHYVGDGDKNAPMRKTPWLNVNDYGNRFMDESVLYEFRCNEAVKYPDVHSIQIFDANYATDIKGMPAQTDPAKDGSFEDFIADGFIMKGDTIEDLAAALEVPADALKATVDRYNELVEKGHDDDYLKDMCYMYAIKQPPFYGIRRQYVISVITGGLEVDESSNVVDADWKPIPGLYAVGNAQGGMFGGTDYPFDITGLSLGRAMTFGYVVGRDLAKA